MSARLTKALPLPRRRIEAFVLALTALMLLGGCATGLRYDSGPRRPADTPASEEPGSAGGFSEATVDLFQVVQEASGLTEEARHPVGAALYQGQARELLGRLAKTRVTPRSFAPRRLLLWLLREVLESGERRGWTNITVHHTRAR